MEKPADTRPGKPLSLAAHASSNEFQISKIKLLTPTIADDDSIQLLENYAMGRVKDSRGTLSKFLVQMSAENDPSASHFPVITYPTDLLTFSHPSQITFAFLVAAPKSI